jgi:hypothetical protein
MAFMCFSKKAVSACELQRQLKHSRYDTVWSLMHRIRNIMGNREALNYLTDIADLNGDAVQIIATVERIRLRRIRKRPANSTPSNKSPNRLSEKSKTNIKASRSKKINLKVKENQENETAQPGKKKKHPILIPGSIKSGQTLAQFIEVIDTIGRSNNKVMNKKWTSIAISNAKRILSGIYHNVHLKFLQLYLDEYCYKLNRRNVKEQIFERLIFASIQNPQLV